MTFQDFLALRVQELERERVALRRRVSTLERSRDRWRQQAQRVAPAAPPTVTIVRRIEPSRRANALKYLHGVTDAA